MRRGAAPALGLALAGLAVLLLLPLLLVALQASARHACLLFLTIGLTPAVQLTLLVGEPTTFALPLLRGLLVAPRLTLSRHLALALGLLSTLGLAPLVQLTLPLGRAILLRAALLVGEPTTFALPLLRGLLFALRLTQ